MLERYLNELIHQATVLEQANNINIIRKNILYFLLFSIKLLLLYKRSI